MWYDTFPTMMQAIAAEKRIKAGSRASKIALIKEMNPEWRDLSEDFG
jgi:putative endonuclease